MANKSVYWIGVFAFFFFKSSAQQLTINVKNNLSFNRKEIIAIPRKVLLPLLSQDPESVIAIKSTENSDFQRTQWMDNNTDGIADELLFLAEVGANATAIYTISAVKDLIVEDEVGAAFSRFVPERSDDYAWENDKVAFRTYGPKGQEEALKGVAGSTLSSGIDIWLKRTNYSVIDNWYKKNIQTPGYYHTDHGEGYDPYHVGKSRGVGGLGIWENGNLLVSDNFVSYKTIAVGPLRTVFELAYAPWSSYEITETKRISLDLDASFSKFEVSLKAKNNVPNYAIGLTTHENKGTAELRTKTGWFRYWEKIDDAFVGEGIVVNPKIISAAFANITNVEDQSNILILTEPTEKLVYYAGFAWQKSGQVSTAEDWDAMLEKQAAIIANPLEILIK